MSADEYTVVEAVVKNGVESSRSFAFPMYANAKSADIKRALGEVERLICDITGQPKESWAQDVMDRFVKIRHDMLNAANAFSRLPTTLHRGGRSISEMDAGTFFNKILS